MTGPALLLKVGDRVHARQRKDFPEGVIVQMLDGDFVLVRWNGHLLETAHISDLALVEAS